MTKASGRREKEEGQEEGEEEEGEEEHFVPLHW